jgi:magnesium transporter
MNQNPDHLQQPVMTVARRDVATLRQDLSVREALEAIRGRVLGEKVVYFYVVDAEERLTGVLPTRRLLTGALDARLRDLMVPRVVAIPQTATLLEACEAFVLHKFLAFPVVDEQRRIVGVVDVSFFTQEVFDMSGEQEESPEHVFEAIGFHVAQVRDASPVRAFRFRFPWLLATIGSTWRRCGTRRP